MKPLAIALLLVGTSTSIAQTKPPTADPVYAAVAQCVELVRQLGAWSAHFDAFYNANTHSVEENAFYNADLPAHYQFRKCMASKGFPLSGR